MSKYPWSLFHGTQKLPDFDEKIIMTGAEKIREAGF